MRSDDGFVLVLSGGSIRGAAHIGALRVLERYNLIPEAIAGSSIGAIVASLYGSGLAANEIERVFLMFRDDRHLLDFNWAGLWRALVSLNLKHFRGIYLGKKLEGLIAANLGRVRRFQDLPRHGPGRLRPVLLSAVNLEDGQETIFAPPWLVPRGEFRICSKQSLAFAARCSSSIPGTFVPAVCDTIPGCPCAGKGRQFYVDGGVRDMYPLTVAVRLWRAARVIGISLGYAGHSQATQEFGPAGYLGHVLDIMGREQEESHYLDREVARAQVMTINPLIYQVGGFEAEQIPAIISRGAAITEECLKSFGLRPDVDRASNLRRLFGDGPSATEYPAKGTPAYARWLMRPLVQSAGQEGGPGCKKNSRGR